MTFKDLKKRISLETTAQTSKLFERIGSKPFWPWDIEEHKAEAVKTRGDCCFNHIIGLPKKEGTDKPMFDYERILYDALLIPENTNSPAQRKILGYFYELGDNEKIKEGLINKSHAIPTK